MLSRLPHQPSDPLPLVLQIVGYKNSGKTTLIAKLIHRLKQTNCIVGTIKHDAHEFDLDTPGTDTWRHQEAGADITAISSATRSAVISRGPEPLSVLLAHMRHADVVLVEGFKQADYPKLILLRKPEDAELLSLANLFHGRPLAGSNRAGDRDRYSDLRHQRRRTDSSSRARPSSPLKRARKKITLTGVSFFRALFSCGNADSSVNESLSDRPLHCSPPFLCAHISAYARSSIPRTVLPLPSRVNPPNRSYAHRSPLACDPPRRASRKYWSHEI